MLLARPRWLTRAAAGDRCWDFLPTGPATEISVDPKSYDNYIGGYEATSVAITVQHLPAQMIVCLCSSQASQKIQIFS